MKNSHLARKFCQYFTAVELGYKKSMMYYWGLLYFPSALTLTVCTIIIIESEKKPDIMAVLSSYLGIFVLACWTAFWFGVYRVAQSGEYQRARTQRLLRQIEDEEWREEMRSNGRLLPFTRFQDGETPNPHQ